MSGSFPPRGPAADVDDVTLRAVARSFFVVRMVRNGLLLVFLAVVLVGVEASDWPQAAAVVVALAMVGLVSLTWLTWRRQRSSSAGSPTA